jgi:uncharacterized damage-inducible protein DinB
MAGLADLLRSHVAYTAWASTRLVQAASELSEAELTHDFQTSDRSILGTLAHIFAADRTWLGRIESAPPHEFIRDSDRRMDVLLKDWPALLDRWKHWAAGVTDDSASATFTYADLRGRLWSQPLYEVVLHVVNHGTHHRGQVSGFLRSLGHTPPRVDYAVFCRER